MLNSLSPLPANPDQLTDERTALVSTPQFADAQKGWPLRKAVAALELMAVASRVPGVSLVNGVLLAEGVASNTNQIEMQGLQLPRVAGISVAVGDGRP